MKKKIGNVELDYQFYNTDKCYSDGAIEEVLLTAAKDKKLNELLYSSNSWAVLYHCSKIRENLLEWYPFDKDSSLLEIGSGCGALTGLFAQKVNSVTCIELSERRSLINAYRNQNYNNIKILLGNFQDIKIEEKFDYITLIGVWEYSGYYINGGGQDPYLSMLYVLKKYLKKNGKILIAIENKMGIKYWNGAVEDHTSKRYSGLNDYVDDENIRTFSRPEIEQMLDEAGWKSYKFYYPMPDYKLPDVIYTDDRLPEPGEIRYYKNDFNSARVYNFYDATISDQLCQDKMMAYFANSFLIECGNNLSDMVYAKYNRTRVERYEIVTIMSKNGELNSVCKKALNDIAQKHIFQMVKPVENCLSQINYAKGRLENDIYEVDYIEGQDINKIFYYYRNDSEKFIVKVKDVIEKYLSPNVNEMVDFFMTEDFRKIFGEKYIEGARCLRVTNVDLTFSNLRLTDSGKMYCIDREWIFYFPIPYEYVLWRSACQLYSKYMIYLKNKVSRQDFLIAIGLNKNYFEVFKEMERNFMQVVNEKDYMSHYRKQIMTYNFRFL